MDKRLRFARFVDSGQDTSADENSYKGLRIYARPGLHVFVAELLVSVCSRDSKVLDLAAGSGAFSARCRDLGFQVSAVDAVEGNFKLRDTIPFRVCDLDETFSHLDGAPFDAVVGIEIIEHLENPWHFFRQCFELLHPGGVLIVTTPNTANPVSKAMLCRFGHSQWFSDDDRRAHGHITSLRTWQFKQCASEAGFQLTDLRSFGDPYEGVRGWWRLWMLARLIDFIKLAPAKLKGEILIGIFAKP